MNDFTKEELEDLYDCCSGGTYDDHPLEDWKASLQLKIKSMIDSYCEHEYSVVYMCDSCKVDEHKCNKCGNVIYEGLE